MGASKKITGRDEHRGGTGGDLLARLEENAKARLSERKARGIILRPDAKGDARYTHF